MLLPSSLHVLFGDPPDPPKPRRLRACAQIADAAFRRNLEEQQAHRHAPQATPARNNPRPSAPAVREREERRAASQERPATPQDTAVPAGAGGAQHHSQGGQGGQDGSDGEQGAHASAAPGLAESALAGALECELLLELLPASENGIFELLLPGGDSLAVLVDASPRHATFLLTPSSQRLRQMLHKRKMELEKGLAQRMDRHVRLTVL